MNGYWCCSYCFFNSDSVYRSKPLVFLSLVVGIGTVVSGVVLKFKPLILGGIVLIGFPFYSVLVSESVLLLLYATVIMISYLVPGYALKRSRA